MELHELHVDQFGACLVSQRVAVARVLPRVAGDLPGLPDAARRQHDGAGAEQGEASRLAEVPEGAGDAPADHEQAYDRALHVDIDSGVHPFVLQHADHLEAGAVADVGQAAVGVAAEGSLIDAPIGRAIEQRAPRLELIDAIGRFLRVDLRHAPVVVHLAAAHRVAEMHAPIVFGHDVAERRGCPALGHDGVCFAEQRFADERDFGLLGTGFDGGAEAGAAGTDYDDVVRVCADILGGHYRTVRASVVRDFSPRINTVTGS